MDQQTAETAREASRPEIRVHISPGVDTEDVSRVIRDSIDRAAARGLMPELRDPAPAFASGDVASVEVDVRGTEEFEQAVRLIEHHERRYEVLARVVTDPNLAAAQVDPQHLGAYVTFAGFVDRGEALHGKARALAKGDVQIRVPVVRDADYATRVLSAVQVLGTLEHRHPHLVLADVLAG